MTNFEGDNSPPPELPESNGLAADASSAQPLLAPPPPGVPEDLRVPWNWSDLLVFVLVCVAGGLLLGIAFVVAFGLFSAARTGPHPPVLERGSFDLLISAILDFCVLGYLAAQVRLRFRLPFWRTIGWLPFEERGIPRSLGYSAFVFGGLALGFLTSVLSSLSPPKHELPVQILFQNRHAAIFLMMMAVAVAPVVEETVFRGYIYPVIARSWGLAAGVVITGGLFGLLHAQQLWGGPWQIAALVFVGIVLTLARATTRTVLASFLIHTGYNAFQVIETLIATHGLRQFPPSH